MFLTNGMWYNCYWCACWFSRKTMFLTNEMRYIYCWWMKLLSLFDLCCLKTCGVWLSGMREICICGMQLTVDVAINDFNWYVVMLIFMMDMWIRNEIAVVVDNVIEMRWCLCWEWHWNGMLMMLEMHWHVHVVYVHGGGAMTLSDVPGGGK